MAYVGKEPGFHFIKLAKLDCLDSQLFILVENGFGSLLNLKLKLSFLVFKLPCADFKKTGPATSNIKATVTINQVFK